MSCPGRGSEFNGKDRRTHRQGTIPFVGAVVFCVERAPLDLYMRVMVVVMRTGRSPDDPKTRRKPVTILTMFRLLVAVPEPR